MRIEFPIFKTMVIKELLGSSKNETPYTVDNNNAAALNN